MSTTLQLAPHGLTVLAASGGIIDWANGKVAELGTLFRGGSIVAGMGFVIYQGIATRGAFARIVISGLAAGVFVWIVWHVTDLRDRTDKEFTPPAAVQLQPDSAGGGTLPALTALAVWSNRPLRRPDDLGRLG